MKYLNCTLRLTTTGIEIEGDERHFKILRKEWSMDQCRGNDTAMTKDLEEKMVEGELLDDESARIVRRAIARVNYMSQDRPDLSVASRMMSQQMANPREGSRLAVRRVIRYLQSHPRCVEHHRWFSGPLVLEGWTDSDWAGDTTTRRSCSGGYVMLNGNILTHWSKTQLNIALSSGEAELIAAVKMISEMIGFSECVSECLSSVACACYVYTDANACKGMLMRRGAGRVKHLSAKQLWCQGAIVSYGVEIKKIPRSENGADMLAHVLGQQHGIAHLARHGCELRSS